MGCLYFPLSRLRDYHRGRDMEEPEGGMEGCLLATAWCVLLNCSGCADWQIGCQWYIMAGDVGA